ncbi:effector-associated constant component EACC1 [Dactylosporangium sp. CA-092794]|uniref:effector-associated constant component EACC1 n=1 Tax=Dactylosporangium sp. CA-092794 TaxID=3239929 RepID=UPI003D8DF845
MEIRLVGAPTGDDYRSLRAELLERDVPGVTLGERAPDPGTLGPVVDVLQVALGSGAAVSSVAAAVITWIRHRSADLDVTMTASDGRNVTVSAKRVRGLRADELLGEIDRMRADLDGAAPPERPELD